MTVIDGAIVAAYLLATLVIALVVRRRAAQSIDSYYLGNKKMPWYLLCLSDASGMFDISGTMWLTTLLFVYGLKSVWLPWLWPVFNQVFLMAFLALWLRRSNVRSGAEWILLRFGEGAGSRLSHLSVVVFALFCVVGFLAYAFVGIGKFMELFIPWETVAPLLGGMTVDPALVPNIYAVFFTSLVTLYVVLGGMPGIVWTDVLQFSIMTIAAIFIAGLAMTLVSPEQVVAATPQGWMNPFFGWSLDLDWHAIQPEVQTKIAADGYGLFGALFMMMLFSGILKSAAGPAPSYDMQRILATRTPRDAAKLTGFVSVVLMPIRYLMITGFTVLALVFVDRLDLVSGGRIDYESILPAAIQSFAPTGMRGLIVTGLLAAFMATFASSLNAAPLYLVNDIYRRYVNPDASQRRMIWMSYAVSLTVVLLSMGIGLFVSSINDALQWIVSGLWGGYTASNVIKWYWWRFNGHGYFWGTVAGMACAMTFPFLFGALLPDMGSVLALYLFPLVILVAGTVAVTVSLMTPPTDMAVLKTFYDRVRPWGFWGPVHRALAQERPGVRPNRNFPRDMFNIAVGTIVQTSLVAVPIFLVLKNIPGLLAAIAVASAGGLILWRTWYRRLEDWPSDMARLDAAPEIAPMTRRTGMRFVAAALLLAVGAGAREAPVAARPGEDLVAYVDPLIGTGGNGHTFPGATVPFGMVQLSPSNDRNGWNWTSGYHYSDEDIKGFAHTHISGAGLSALGDILLMPTRSPSTDAGSAERPGSGYRSRFSHARELARPGYYRVHLDDPDVDAELTAAARAGFHRYTYRGDAARYVVIDPTHSVGDHAYRTEVEIVSDHEIRGWKRAISQSSGDRSVFFVARFSQPFASARLTEDDRPVEGRARTGRAIKALVQFAPEDGDSVEVAVALSHTGEGGAQANFDADARGRTFDAALADATRLWQERLSRITIEGDARQKRLFYTAAYHAAIAPNLVSDVTGAYYLDGKVRQSRIPQFSNFSNWDTYRALHPLLTIIDTKKDGEIVASMVSRHAEQGLLLPSWEAVGHDNRVMIGYSIVSPIADAVLKGIPGVDPEAAYAAIRASAFDTTKHSNVYDANGMAGYLAYGFVPADVASSVSKTTEQNYEDWAIGRVAEKLGKRADAALFAERATGWRQLYDPANGYLLPRLADGSRVPVPMDTWDTLNRHYVSGNIWAYSSYTPHDMVAAIRLHGGREAYARWLEGIFTDTRPIGGEQHVDISGFIGRYAHGDEPGHHMAWLFNLVGEPWLTQRYVNRLVREMYADRPDGLVNNEDLGQMSAWYLLATLGFYPIAPGDLTYQITAPHHRRATIGLESGKTFVVEADGLTPENIFVQSATLDGKPYPYSYIRHERIMAGGVLRFEMGPKPNRAWGSDPRETSLGAFDDKLPAEVPHRAAWAPFNSDAAAYFAGSRTVVLQTAEPGAVIRYTLDGREPDGRSRRYAGPLRISHDTVLKAVALREGLAMSTIFEKHYARAATVGLGPGYPRIAIAEPDMPYGRADGAMLIDQQRGTRFYGDKKWSGRLGDITATIDLGRSRPVRSVTIGYLDDPMNGILVPRRIEIWAGSEAGALSLVGSRDVAAPHEIRQAVDRLRIPVRGSFRHYQVRVLSAGTMPPGLSPPGRKAWLFLDEILLQ